MKKAQIEMMGLVVIILIIAIGFLFLVSYLTKGGERESAQQIYQKELLAYNTIGAVIQATPGCGLDISISDLIDDCVSFNEMRCLGLDSCSYVTLQTAIILNKTLNIREQEYYFYILDAQGNLKAGIASGECRHNRVSATQPLTSRSGELIIGIDICG
ncbi:hypothetical protein KY312_00175 [Candidatus Woesearchaeota archaeon]|nr:hypothetical protein [Candidatus Woesearchaeota archaeon]